MPEAVIIESSHTLSTYLSIAISLSSLYLFSMSQTFCTSVPITVCIDLSMPCILSLLSLSGLALAPPSSLTTIVFGWSMWQQSWHKKPKTIERSPLNSHHPAKRNTNTNHINIIQLSLFLHSKIAFDRGEAVSKAREPQMIMQMCTLYSLDSCSCCMPKLNLILRVSLESIDHSHKRGVSLVQVSPLASGTSGCRSTEASARPFHSTIFKF